MDDQKILTQTLLYQLLTTLEMVVDLSMKVVGIYLFFFKLEPVNGAIVLGMSSLWTIQVLLARMYPLFKDGPRVYINLPPNIVIDKQQAPKEN